MICKALNVNKSSYLYWLNHGKYNDDISITFFQEVLVVYFLFKGIYGAPKIAFELNKKNIICSTTKVSRVMRLLGIRSIVAKKYPYKRNSLRDKEKVLIINLIKDLTITHLNQVWTTDITYINTIHDGNLYLISFLDLYSKKVVAWGLFYDQRTDKILLVLSDAIISRKPSPGLIVHSDKGAQMRSKLYRQFLKSKNFAFSYTSLNHSCDENAAQESFHSLIKKEVIYVTKLYSYEDAYRVIYDYIEGFYNPIRINSSLGYKSPIEFENSIKNTQYPLS